MKRLPYKKNNRSGFTMIELLLVIAIIGLLLTASMYALNQGRQKSRDAKRIADLSTMAKALELYYTQNGQYPPSPCGHDCSGYYYSYSSNWQILEAELSPFLASKLPVDPINSDCSPWETGTECFAYSYGNVGKDTYGNMYDLSARLETKNHPESCGQKNHKFYFDGRDMCGPHSTQMYEASPQ